MVNSILNKIKDVFEVKEVKYYCEEEKGRIGANFFDSVMMFHVEPDMVTYKMVFKGDVPEEKRKDVREYLNDINCILKEGHMEMDDDGTVTFRISVDMSEEPEMSEYRLLSIMGKGVHAEDTFHGGIKHIVEGNMEPRKAFKDALYAVRKRNA